MIERAPGDKVMTPYGYGWIARVMVGTPCPFEVYQFEERISRVWDEQHLFTLPPGTTPGIVYGNRPRYDNAVR